MSLVEVSDEIIASVTELAERLQISSGTCLERVLKIGVHTLRCESPRKVISDEEKEKVRDSFGIKTCAEIAGALGLRRKDIKAFWVVLVSEYIKEHWQIKSDAEIARAVKWKVVAITDIRCRLGLYRPDIRYVSHRSDSSVSRKINPVEVRELLLNGGKTMTDLISYYGLRVTRERMRQICHDRDCWVNPSDRTIKWYVARYNNPDLADAQKLRELLVTHKSLSSLAVRLGIYFQIVERILLLHGISFSRKTAGERITLTCSNPDCGKQFVRWKKVVERSQVKYPSCSLSCRRVVFTRFLGWQKGQSGRVKKK